MTNFPDKESLYKLTKPSPRFFKTHYPEFYEYIESLDGGTFSEKLYRYLHPEPHVCAVCGTPTAYRNFVHGYNVHCSTACTYKDKECVRKAERTKIERYGDANYNNRESARKTCQEHYGVDNPYQAEEVKSKLKSIYNERYGTDYPSQAAEVQDVRRTNSLEKYGVDHHTKTTEFRKKISKILRDLSTDPNLIGWDGDYQIRKCPHPECNKCEQRSYKIHPKHYHTRKKFNIEPCTTIHPLQIGKNKMSFTERSIRELLAAHDIQTLPREDRTILPSHKGLDIVLPQYKIAIECNGDWWHSEALKPYKYHVDKYIEARSIGYQLLTVWDDQFANHPDIVKSVILSKLGIYEVRIGARQCKLRQISSRDCNNFLNANHLQGASRSSVHLGAYYKDELVGVMCFAKRSKLSGGKNDDCWELTRFCTLLNWQVLGLAARFIKMFIKQYSPDKIVSFSSNDISNGDVYKKLDFETDSKITPAYWYIHKQTNRRYHRTSFCKTRLAQLGFDTNRTEAEIMSELPYHKIWDSGHVKHTLYIKPTPE
jgi:very-short-patch-repair endonuclease